MTVELLPLYKTGTNSTLFTECCRVAICDDEPQCPGCGADVVGHAAPQHERGRIRWENATRNWKRPSYWKWGKNEWAKG